MTKYRKKPIEVEAFRWLLDESLEWWKDVSRNFRVNIITGSVFIPTNEGVMECRKGDWIIKEPFDEEREVYSCKPDIFEKTYEKVEL